jgi:outer membrane biosynthesis protein TonB
MKQTAHQDIVSSLKLLQRVHPDEDFRNRMEQKVAGHSGRSSHGKYSMPFFALRVAAAVFVVLLGVTGLVSASANSTPGQMLYPVKQLVNEVRIAFPSDKYISTAPTITVHPVKESPTETPPPQPTPTETVTTDQQTLPAADYKPQEANPTQTPTPTPTTTPTPQSNPPAGGHANEGSKDNGSNAGAGGSLLPKLKIHL